LRRGLQTTMCCTCGPPQGDESALLRFIDSKQVTRDFRRSSHEPAAHPWG
jgi:hypothetical protein